MTEAPGSPNASPDRVIFSVTVAESDDEFTVRFHTAGTLTAAQAVALLKRTGRGIAKAHRGHMNDVMPIETTPSGHVDVAGVLLCEIASAPTLAGGLPYLCTRPLGHRPPDAHAADVDGVLHSWIHWHGAGGSLHPGWPAGVPDDH